MRLLVWKFSWAPFQNLFCRGPKRDERMGHSVGFNSFATPVLLAFEGLETYPITHMRLLCLKCTHLFSPNSLLISPGRIHSRKTISN